MRSLTDLLAIVLLASVGFLTWADTPLGRDMNGDGLQIKSEEKRIIIDYPDKGEKVYGYLNVMGKARVSSSDYYIRVRDKVTGEQFFQEKITIFSPKIGDISPWQYELNLASFLEGKHLLIETYNISKEGKEESLTSVPVVVWRVNRI